MRKFANANTLIVFENYDFHILSVLHYLCIESRKIIQYDYKLYVYAVYDTINRVI